MPTKTDNERLAVLEEQIKEMKSTMRQGFDESKGFHPELIDKLDRVISNNNTNIRRGRATIRRVG